MAEHGPEPLPSAQNCSTARSTEPLASPYNMDYRLSISWTWLFMSCVLATGLWELVWIVYCKTLHPLAKIPGPFLASVSRLWIWKSTRSGDMHHIQSALHQKYGSVIRIAPNEIACSDPSAINEIYRNQNPLQKSDFYSVWTSKSFGKHKDNFSVTNEKEHASRRRIVNHIYSLSNVLKPEAYIDQCSALFMQKLGSFADRNETVDLGQWLQMYAFDVIGELYFGQMCGFMDTGTDYESLIHSLDVLNPVMVGMAVSATYARTAIVLSAILSSSVRTALKAIDHVTSTAKNCVRQRLEQLKAGNENKNPRYDLLQQLIETVQVKGKTADFGILEVEYESYVALFAGSDTTAIAMRSVFYHLAHSPKVLEAVLAEIDEQFPTSSYPSDKAIAYADAIKLPMLRATIKEAMRLHPSVAFTMPRISPSDGLCLDDRFIPAGYRVGLNAYVVQRDEEIFGNDANEFNPERWLENNKTAEQLRAMDRCMLNFGAGTRTCTGKNISLSEMHKLIPQILRTFTLKLVDDKKAWTHHNFWFNKQIGMNFVVNRRLPTSPK